MAWLTKRAVGVAGHFVAPRLQAGCRDLVRRQASMVGTQSSPMDARYMGAPKGSAHSLTATGS